MKKLTVITLLMTLVLSSFVYAHSGATGVIKQRIDMMGEVAKAMKSIGQMIKGEVDYNPNNARSAALEIEKHARGFSELFPEGSTTKPSEALPIIWEDWEEFTKLLDQMKTQANQLAELAPTVATVGEIKTQFALVGKTCGTCHKKFRLKK